MSEMEAKVQNSQKRVVKKRTFKRRVHISEDQNTVCNEAVKCIFDLDTILSYMENIVEGANNGDTEKINEIKKKLEEIQLLVVDV